MYLYILFFILAFLSIVEIDIQNNKFAKKSIFALLLFVLFCLSFLRWEVGTDWNSYYNYYKALSAWSDTYGGFEYGFDSIAKFLRLELDASYTVFLLVQAIILYTLYYKSIPQYTDRPIFSLFALYSFSFAGLFFVRQTLAIAIILFSIQFIIQRRFFYFLICIVLAMGFHRTSFIFIPAYFIFNLTLSKTKIVLCLSVTFLLGYIFANSIIGQLGQVLGGVIEHKIDVYQERGSDYSSGAFSAFQTMVRGASYRIAFILFILLFMYKSYQKDSKFRGLINIYLAGTLLFFITVPISTAFIRISTYYEIVQMFLYPYILNISKNKTVKYLIVLIIIIYLLFRFIGVVQVYEDEYIPYKSILTQ